MLLHGSALQSKITECVSEEEEEENVHGSMVLHPNTKNENTK